MRIGIITFWQSQDNYGQILQCFALQRYLRKQGHNPFLIRYIASPAPTSHVRVSKIIEYIIGFRAYIRYAKSLVNQYRYQKANVGADRKFLDFVEKNIVVSDKIYTRADLMSNPPLADAYICGSDQIWGGEDIYYLPFAPDESVKIAYAPSFGGIKKFSSDKEKLLKHLVSRLDFIGMREGSGVQILKNLGIDRAVQVVDPTLLLNRDDYLDIGDKTDEVDHNGNNCFVYLLGNDICCGVDKIFKFIRRQRMTYTYVASQGRVDRYNKTAATIVQWIDGIRQSRFVITNSFHCVVFSLIFHRPFIFVPLSGSFSRMNDRVVDLLEKCNMTDRIFNGDFSSIPTHITFDDFDSFKAKESKRCGSLLNESLNNK